MIRFVVAITAVIAALAPSALFAQQPSSPGPYVVDFRGVMSGVPQGTGFFPVVGSTTLLPKRGFGLGGGIHVYPFHLGVARIGIGVDGARIRGTAQTTTATGKTASTSTATSPATAAMDMTTVAGQVSFNFGSREGWSYLTAGYGNTRTRSEVTSDVLGPIEHSVIVLKRHSPTINYGGGARWFIRTHMAVGFDLRFHRMSAVDAQPGTRVFSLSVGVSVR